jgi:hypothetical protein
MGMSTHLTWLVNVVFEEGLCSVELLNVVNVMESRSVRTSTHGRVQKCL